MVQPLALIMQADFRASQRQAKVIPGGSTGMQQIVGLSCKSQTEATTASGQL